MKGLFKIHYGSELTSLSPNPPPLPHGRPLSPNSKNLNYGKWSSLHLNGVGEPCKPRHNSVAAPDLRKFIEVPQSRKDRSASVSVPGSSRRQRPISRNYSERKSKLIQSRVSRSIAIEKTRSSHARSRKHRPDSITEYNSKRASYVSLNATKHLKNDSVISIAGQSLLPSSSNFVPLSVSISTSSLSQELNLLDLIPPISPIVLQPDVSKSSTIKQKTPTTSSLEIPEQSSARSVVRAKKNQPSTKECPKLTLDINPSNDRNIQQHTELFDQYVLDTFLKLDTSPGLSNSFSKWFLPSPTLAYSEDKNKRLSQSFNAPHIPVRQSSLPDNRTVLSPTEESSAIANMGVESSTYTKAYCASISSRGESSSSIFDHKSGSSFSSTDTVSYYTTEKNGNDSISFSPTFRSNFFDNQPMYNPSPNVVVSNSSVNSTMHSQKSSNSKDPHGPETQFNSHDSHYNAPQLALSPKSNAYCIPPCNERLGQLKSHDEKFRTSSAPSLPVRNILRQEPIHKQRSMANIYESDRKALIAQGKPKSSQTKNNTEPSKLNQTSRTTQSKRRGSEPAFNKELPRIPDRNSITPQPRGRKGMNDNAPMSYYEWNCIDANLNKIANNINKWSENDSVENQPPLSTVNPTHKTLEQSLSRKLYTRTSSHGVSNPSVSRTSSPAPLTLSKSKENYSTIRSRLDLPDSPTSIYSDLSHSAKYVPLEPIPKHEETSSSKGHHFHNSYAALINENPLDSIYESQLVQRMSTLLNIQGSPTKSRSVPSLTLEGSDKDYYIGETSSDCCMLGHTEFPESLPESNMADWDLSSSHSEYHEYDPSTGVSISASSSPAPPFIRPSFISMSAGSSPAPKEFAYPWSSTPPPIPNRESPSLLATSRTILGGIKERPSLDKLRSPSLSHKISLASLNLDKEASLRLGSLKKMLLKPRK